MTFEKYLQDKHADQYQGLDDEMPDNFSEWLEDMGPDEMIEYAEKWHEAQLAPLREVWEKYKKEYSGYGYASGRYINDTYNALKELAKQEGWDNQTGDKE